MFFKIASFVLSFILLTCFFSYSCRAQFIASEIYETEEDLREGLEMGFLTLDQYLELLDMMQSKLYPASKEADRLFFVPDMSNADLSQIKGQKLDLDLDQKMAAFLAQREKKDRAPLSGRLVWKFYEEFQQQGETESYLFCEVGNRERLIWRIEADQQVNSSESILSQGDFRVRRRFLNIMLPEYSSELVFGNFDKRIGLGLNVGYHPLFGYTSESEPHFEDSFLYPTRGRFNGILGESKFRSLSVLAFYSRNKRGQIENEIQTLDLILVKEEVQVGACLSAGELKNTQSKSTFTDDCTSLHFDFVVSPVRFSGEYALLPNEENALAFDLYSRRKPLSFDFSWWRYGDDFIHPHGGGISNPDYETIHLDEIDFDYRSRQAGERGIFFKSRYTILEKLNLDFSYNQWRERSYLPEKMKFRVGTGYDFSPEFSFAIYQLWTDYNVEDEEIDRKTSSLDLFVSPYPKLELNLIANYRTTHAKDYGDLRVKIRTAAVSPLEFVLWAKYNDPNFSRSSDGYFSFHVQEDLRFSGNFFFSAEYMSKFYQDESKDDTQSARVKVEILW
ncbi:MAG: hypothetical protein GTO24_19400 [candidate division Zixibacteria bacterium]|nr:hypothetical protein [candidate division Zixibacteria bacterium]